jgi:hypothetical protein
MMASLVGDSWRMQAMVRPSGDHAGESLRAGLSVNREGGSTPTCLT